MQKNQFSITAANGLGLEQEWSFSALPQKHSRFGPDFVVKSGTESANIRMDEAGFHSDNQPFTNSMPAEVANAYEGYIVGALDAYEQTKHPKAVAGSGWQETGNHVAHSSEASSGWRIHSLVSDTNPPAFKVKVKAPNGHVTEYAFDNKKVLVVESTAKNPLPQDVHQVAMGMLTGQQHGAALAHGRSSSLVERLEAQRKSASVGERSR